MPLCWAHAEYVSLVRSHQDGVCFDRIEPAYQRYVGARTGSALEMWSLAHPSPGIARGKALRIILDRPAAVHWSFDGWKTAMDQEAADAGFGCWFVDLPSDRAPAGGSLLFTFQWKDGWHGKDFQVEVFAPTPGPKAQLNGSMAQRAATAASSPRLALEPLVDK